MHKEEHGQKWNAQHAGKLDNEERRRILPPTETIEKLGLAAGMNFADVGCGIGYFTLPAAKITGEKAKVYALDVSADMLGILKQRAAEQGLQNIKIVQTEPYDLKLESGCADFALCSLVLHEVEDKHMFLQEIARVLRPKGVLAVIEWKKVKGERGPSEQERIAEDELKSALQACGFANLNTTEINQDMYAVVATI